MSRVRTGLLLFLEIFTLVGALVGTWGLLHGGMGMGPQVLADSPFSAWWQAALALFVVNALLPAAVIVAHLRRAAWGPWAHLAYGFVLVGWIVGQVAFVGYISLLQPVMAATGVVIAGLASGQVRHPAVRTH